MYIVFVANIYIYLTLLDPLHNQVYKGDINWIPNIVTNGFNQRDLKQILFNKPKLSMVRIQSLPEVFLYSVQINSVIQRKVRNIAIWHDVSSLIMNYNF